MLKKTITYVDYLGTTRTEDLYFNLSKADLSDMQMSVDGGLSAKLESMVKAANNREVYNQFNEIILEAYGELSPDGKYHIKKDPEGHRLADRWRQSPSYDAFMDEICQSEASIAEFCRGIVPKNLNHDGTEKHIPQDHQVKQFHRPEDK